MSSSPPRRRRRVDPARGVPVAAFLVVAVVAAVWAAGRGGPDAVGATPTAGPTHTVAGPAPGPSALAAPPSGASLLTWESDVAGTGIAVPWLSGIVDAGDTWLATAVTGDPGGPGESVFLTIDPYTGQVRPAGADAALPESVTCADEPLDGLAVCVWDGAVHRVDPRTGEPVAGAFAALDGAELRGVAVADRTVVAAGTAPQGVLVAGFDDGGILRWDSLVSVDGCFATGPAAAEVSVVGDVARIGVGAVQALVAIGDGTVALQLCGRTALADSGAVAVLAAGGGEPTPPSSYTDPAGVVHPVLDLRTAGDALPVTAQGRSSFAVIDAEDHLALVDADSGAQTWRQTETLSGSSLFQGADDERVYVGSVNGLRAVTLVDGATAWTWRPGMGVAYRAATPTPGGVLAFSSSGVWGLHPRTGATLWAVDGYPEAAFYWSPRAAADAGGATTVVVLGPTRDHLGRLDIPALPQEASRLRSGS